MSDHGEKYLNQESPDMQNKFDGEKIKLLFEVHRVEVLIVISSVDIPEAVGNIDLE